MTFDEMKAFEGKDCIVTLTRSPELVEIRGRLISLKTYGDAELELADGNSLFVWPVLDIREDGK